MSKEVKVRFSMIDGKVYLKGVQRFTPAEHQVIANTINHTIAAQSDKRKNFSATIKIKL